MRLRPWEAGGFEDQAEKGEQEHGGREEDTRGR